MLKWIGGCLLLVIVGAAVLFYVGYRKVQDYAAKGPSATVMIGAPAERVFAAISDADSLTDWRAEGLGIRASRKGMLRVGDTLLIQERNAGPNREQRSTWVVTAVTPGRLIAAEMRSDSGVFVTRRDSIAPMGDSTQITTVLAAPGMDSVITRVRDSSRAGGAMMGTVGKLMIAAMRAQTNMELQRLKRHIEVGPSAPDSTTAAPTPPAPPTKSKTAPTKSKS